MQGIPGGGRKPLLFFNAHVNGPKATPIGGGGGEKPNGTDGRVYSLKDMKDLTPADKAAIRQKACNSPGVGNWIACKALGFEDKVTGDFQLGEWKTGPQDGSTGFKAKVEVCITAHDYKKEKKPGEKSKWSGKWGALSGSLDKTTGTACGSFEMEPEFKAE